MIKSGEIFLLIPGLLVIAWIIATIAAGITRWIRK